jgi:hypothetical protein
MMVSGELPFQPTVDEQERHAALLPGALNQDAQRVARRDWVADFAVRRNPGDRLFVRAALAQQGAARRWRTPGHGPPMNWISAAAPTPVFASRVNPPHKHRQEPGKVRPRVPKHGPPLLQRGHAHAVPAAKKTGPCGCGTPAAGDGFFRVPASPLSEPDTPFQRVESRVRPQIVPYIAHFQFDQTRRALPISPFQPLERPIPISKCSIIRREHRRRDITPFGEFFEFRLSAVQIGGLTSGRSGGCRCR